MKCEEVEILASGYSPQLFVTVPFELEENERKAELMNINEFGLCSSQIQGDTATGVGKKRQLVGRNIKAMKK